MISISVPKRQPNDIFEKFNYDEIDKFEKIAFKREEARLVD